MLHVGCSLVCTESQAGQRPGSWHSLQGASSPASPYLSASGSTGSSLCPAAEQQWQHAIHSIYPPLPRIALCHSLDVHTPKIPASSSPLVNSTQLKTPYSTRSSLIKEQPGLTFPSSDLQKYPGVLNSWSIPAHPTKSKSYFFFCEFP